MAATGSQQPAAAKVTKGGCTNMVMSPSFPFIHSTTSGHLIVSSFSLGHCHRHSRLLMLMIGSDTEPSEFADICFPMA